MELTPAKFSKRFQYIVRWVSTKLVIPVFSAVAITPSKSTCNLWNIDLDFWNFNDEIYQTLQMSFLNYLLIIKAKVWDLCIIIIIIIISFSLLIAFHIMPNDWIVWWVQLNPAKCAKPFLISCALGKYHLNYILTFHLWNSAKRNREVAVIWHC